MDLTLPDATFLLVGVAALMAVFLPRLVEGRAISLPIVFLALGVIVGLLPGVPFEVVPSEHPTLTEHLTEVVVIIALMGAGLALDRPPGWARWQNTWRLLAVGMPLTIAAVALLGWWALGLAPATAILLGAVLAPTDPVLAGEVQVGKPSHEPVQADQAEEEVRFSLTSEAGLNDALAFPFVYLAILLATSTSGLASLLGGWAAYELSYKIVVGLIVGWAVGKVLGRLSFSAARQVLRLAEHREGSVAIAATFTAYGLAEVLGGYGFLAVFIAAVAIRSSERFHDYHQELHHFIEQIERLLTVIVLLLLGAAIADGLLADLDWRHVVVVAVVLLVVRPLLGLLALTGGRGTPVERAVMAFFGVRGVGSIYYVAYAVGQADLERADTVWAVVGLTVAVSVVLHGVTAGPVMTALDRHRLART